jgi:hypothetical protein
VLRSRAWLIAALFICSFPVMADSIAFTSVSEPEICGSGCTPAVTQNNTGVVSGGILSSITSLDQVEFAQTHINLTTGDAGVAVGNDLGLSNASASHFDTWFCPDPVACAALAAPGSFIPVTIDLRVEGNASLTPGSMSLSYSYTATSLLGSTALGTFEFLFFEDPGRGPDADIEGTATFQDSHTLQQYETPVAITSQGFDTGFIAFSAGFTITTYIGGCAAANCDLSQGIFTDIQTLSAQIEGADSAQVLDSYNTFQVGITSDRPFVSADGRTAGAESAAPEPGSLSLVLIAAIAVLPASRRACRKNSQQTYPVL